MQRLAAEAEASARTQPESQAEVARVRELAQREQARRDEEAQDALGRALEQARAEAAEVLREAMERQEEERAAELAAARARAEEELSLALACAEEERIEAVAQAEESAREAVAAAVEAAVAAAAEDKQLSLEALGQRSRAELERSRAELERAREEHKAAAEEAARDGVRQSTAIKRQRAASLGKEQAMGEAAAQHEGDLLLALDAASKEAATYIGQLRAAEAENEALRAKAEETEAALSALEVQRTQGLARHVRRRKLGRRRGERS